MASAEECKLLGNESVANKNWEAAYSHYLRGITCLQPTEGNLRVILTSNISLVLLQLSRYQEALEEASKCIELDPKFEKGYLRYAAALEALNLKVADVSLVDSCPVMKTYRKGLEVNPGSSLLSDAMKISFPFVSTTAARTSKSSSKTKSSKANKKQLSGTAKAEREACVSLDIRGATGQHELRVNGRYDPTDELSGGWPMYRKRIEVVAGEDDEVDEDDNLILEFHSGLDEWMVKHVSCKGSHRSFVFLKCSPPTRPELCRSSSWQSMEDKKLTNQTSMSVLTISQRHEEDVAFFRRERDSCVTIEVRGALGRKALGINGVFEPTEDCCGGWPVYRKIADIEADDAEAKAKIAAENTKDSCSTNSSSGSNPPPSSSSSAPLSTSVWMEYNPYFRSWQVKPTPCLGTNRSWGYSNTNTMHGTLPQLSMGVWEVLEDEDFRPQESICLMTLTQWQIEDEKLAQLWSSSCAIDVRGATGTYGPIVNGVYEPLSTFVSGYQKRTDPKCVIEYSRMRKLWQLKCSQGPCAFVPDDSRSLPELSSAVWYVMVHGNWERQPTVKISSLSSRKSLDNDMYGDKLTDATPLDVRGATGVNSFKINGVYEPIDEFSGGWPVYQRKGGVDYWLEYNEERGNWQIKSASHRGMDSAFAYVDSFPSKYPQRCGGTWWVYTGVRGANSNSGWEMQQSVTILSVVDRTAEDMKSYEKRKVHCVPLDIRGATGPRGGGLNGIFDPTDEMRGGWPVYLKRDDGEWWLEYDACPQKWMIRPTACRGTTRGRAYILCDPHTRPERAKGVWRLSDGKGGWAPEPTVQVISESDAISQDKVLFDARRAVALDIAIRGAIKPVGHINGIYEPTNESWHAWPIYKKKGCDTHYLEYHAPSSSWQVKPATVRGTKRCWAYVHSESEHPELSVKSWLVIINGEHLKQDSIAITTLTEQAQSDKTLGTLRRKSCNPIKVRGAVGKHASAINGIYEPSLTELCGGWPVYYNNSSIKVEEKSVGTKSSVLKVGENISTDATKSFLLFCPYAMSWAITVLASVNDTSEGSEELVVTTDSAISVMEAKVVKEGSEKSTDSKSKVSTRPSSSSSAALSTSTDSSSSPSKTIVKSKFCLPFYSPSSAPLTLAFFEVMTNAQPEIALGTATWKVLSGAQFEPQVTIKVSVVADINAAKTPPAIGISLKPSIPKPKGTIAVNKPAPGSSQTAMNLTQIGVKIVEKKSIPDAIPDTPVPSSSSAISTRSHALEGKAVAALGAKDAKKNSWQNRAIVTAGPDTVPQSPQIALRGISTPEGKTSWVKPTVIDSNSDDGVGVSNSEVEDEWLEVKQKRPKGPYSSVSVNTTRGGPQSTPSASTLKGPSSRSSSPAAPHTPSNPTISTTPGSDSFAAALTKSEKREEASSSPPPPQQYNPPNPPKIPLGPTSQIPVVSTMGFKAAVMSGQSEASTAQSSFSSTGNSQSQQSQSTRQSFSADDFPAMPFSTSSAQRLALAAPAAIAVVAAVAVVAALPPLEVPVTPISDASTPTGTTGTNTMKKLSKTKKKAWKNGAESAQDLPKESSLVNGNAGNVPEIAPIAESSDLSVDILEKPIPELTVLSVPPTMIPDTDIAVSTYDEARYLMPQMTPITPMTPMAPMAPITPLTPMAPMAPITPLTAQGSYTTHVTQGAYDIHTPHTTSKDMDRSNHGMNHVLNGHDDVYLHTDHSTHPTHHTNNYNGHISHSSGSGGSDDYMYQRPLKGDEEDDDDLFKAISSANAIDFDPSFTANNISTMGRPIGSTLSPLSRRIGSRNDVNNSIANSNNDNNNSNNNHINNINGNDNRNIPRHPSDNMRHSPYSSLLETNVPAPLGPLSKAEGFLSNISFDFFSSLLQSGIPEVGICSLLRKEGSILDVPHLSNDINIASNNMSHRYDSHLSLEMMNLNDLQSGLSPLCNEYQYRGPLPGIRDERYQDTDHSKRYQMPTLTPIPTSHLSTSFGIHPDNSHTNSHMKYSQSRTLDLTQNLPNPYNSSPILFTARELSVATDNFSSNNLINLKELKAQDLSIKTGRAKIIHQKELEKEKERDSSTCTFVGLLRSTAVIIKIITPNTDSDINNTLQSQYLRELRVLSEVIHPYILPLWGYTFRPYARIYKIPIGMLNHDIGSIYTDSENDLKNSSSVGYYSLSCLLKNIEKRKKFSWKMRIRIITCIIRALAYLHIGDSESGRCPIVHCNIHTGNIILENFEGEAFLTDFTQSRDIFPPIDTKKPLEMSVRDGTDEDLHCVGVIFIQLLVGQWDKNHSDVLRVLAFFNLESNPPPNGSRRKKDFISGKNSTNPLDAKAVDEIVTVAENEIWPTGVIPQLVELLTSLFSVSHIDPNGDPVKRGAKCEQLLVMLQHMWA